MLTLLILVLMITENDMIIVAGETHFKVNLIMR